MIELDMSNVWGELTLPQLLETGITLIGELAAGAISAIPTFLMMIPDLFKQAVDAFKAVDWASIGSDIINGVINGIKKAGSALFQSLKDLASSALESAKSALKIGSPSRLFADEVGQWIPEGIAVGIDANAESVSESVDDMVKDSVVEPSIDVLGEVSGLFTPAAMGMITAPAGNDNTDSLLGQYLPLLLDAIKNSKFDVNLDGNIIARSVRKYDDSFKKANGVSMFA